jgi:hypothetical protein
MPHQFAYLYMYGTAGLRDAMNDTHEPVSLDELLWPDVAAIDLDFSDDTFEKVLDLALQEVNDEDDTTGFEDSMARYHRGNIYREQTSEGWSEEQNNAIAQVWTYTFYEGTAEHHNPHPLFMIGVQKRYLSLSK